MQTKQQELQLPQVAQEARGSLVDLRVGNKPEVIPGEAHEWKAMHQAYKQWSVADGSEATPMDAKTGRAALDVVQRLRWWESDRQINWKMNDAQYKLRIAAENVRLHENNIPKDERLYSAAQRSLGVCNHRRCI